MHMSDDSRDPSHLPDAAAAGNDLSGLPGAAPLVDQDTANVDVMDHVRETVLSAAERVRAAARERFEMDDPAEELRRLEHEAQAYVRRNPLRTVAVAFAAGYLIARIRRL
jgi:ElaB/YqjD/DUF883 family membrane-anchored ribosome-binding protein